ncbi:alpha/beta hydrolase family protein [Oerskovia flava]|uniref:alpha/beta hydrolase family protein n=1 Tax=Oerskovia flava TaxID=2986422 RepID=UPI0022401C93|nr:acyl-CoA thioester hydrolase/BAAT C-terminal domain-containing protein [Oerskovia sp. JB1-3-2]
MIFRTAATSAALAIVLAVVGALAGPQWDPVPVADHVTPETTDTTIGGQVAGAIDAVGTYQVREVEATVELDGTSVDALIREPVDAPGDRPGVVFLHGAGTGTAHEAFAQTASALASAGVVTLVPSKRLDTYSTRYRDYESMAVDYAHSVELLRSRPLVDPARVGLYGESEGTWVVPVLAVQDPTIAFSILVSAPVVPPRQQAAYAADSYLRNTGVPRSVFRAIPRAVGMVLPGGGFEYADFEVDPFLRELSSPVLMAYGTSDPSMPVEQGALQVIDDVASNGNDDVSVRYYDGANHGIRIDGQLVPEFLRDLSAWVQGLPDTAGASPQVAGAQPDQVFLAAPVPAPRWFGNGDLVIGLVVAGLGLLVLGPLVWAGSSLVRRARRRDAPVARIAPGLRWPLVVLGTGAVATMVGLVVYLMSVARLALEYERDAWVVHGGWIAVRALGLVTVVAAAMIVNRSAELRTTRRALARGPRHVDVRDQAVLVRPAVGVVGHLTYWSTIVGATLLLVTVAYWGVYQLGI